MYISEIKIYRQHEKTWDCSTYRNVDWKIPEGHLESGTRDYLCYYVIYVLEEVSDKHPGTEAF